MPKLHSQALKLACQLRQGAACDAQALAKNLGCDLWDHRPPGPGRHPARAGPAEEPLSAPVVLLGGCRLRRSQAWVLGEEAHALEPGDSAPFRTELGLPGSAPVLGRGAHFRLAGAGDLSGAAIQQGYEVAAGNHRSLDPRCHDRPHAASPGAHPIFFNTLRVCWRSGTGRGTGCYACRAGCGASWPGRAGGVTSG